MEQDNPSAFDLVEGDCERSGHRAKRALMHDLTARLSQSGDNLFRSDVVDGLPSLK
ncbi:hypothetical protein [Bradyrhizobium sp. URHC0002]